MTALLDANVLIALVVPEHVHHEPARQWFRTDESTVATCAITQESLLRLLMQRGYTSAEAWPVLEALTAHPRHEFWPESIPYREVPSAGVVGHRQVTDAYLAQLARAAGGRLVAFDQGLAAAHPDVAWLVPTASR